jgi:hypothetical protein
MGHWLDEGRYRHEGVTIPRIRVTLALSLLVHAAALFLWLPHTKLLAPWSPEQDLTYERLQVWLAPAPAPKPATEPEPPREIVALARPRVQPPKAASPQRPQPAMTAPATAAPAIPVPPAVAPPAPEVARANQSIVSDLWPTSRRGAVSAATGKRLRPTTPRRSPTSIAPISQAGHRRRRSGQKQRWRHFRNQADGLRRCGVRVLRLEHRDGRRTPQLIEVRRGENSDMRIAVVTDDLHHPRVLKEDFVWRSPRRGVDVVLSARLSDNSALESFLLHDLFDDSSHRIQ